MNLQEYLIIPKCFSIIYYFNVIALKNNHEQHNSSFLESIIINIDIVNF